MKRNKLSLGYITGRLTVLIPRMEDATKRQTLSLIFLVMATILEYIRGLLTVLTPRMEDATKRQMRSLISLVMAAMFTMTSFVPVVEAGSAPYTITKSVDNVTYIGNGTVTDGNGTVTDAGDIISYHINVNNTENLDNANVTDLLVNLNNNNNLIGTGYKIDPSDNHTVILGNLSANVNATLYGNYTINQDDINSNGTEGSGFINNTATLFVNNGFTGNYTASTKIIQTPTLALDKTADKQNYSAVGDVITYNYNVTNTGNVGISGNITVTDDKLGNFTIANSVLAPDSSVEGTSNHTINQDDLDAGSIINSANATVGSIISNTDSVTVNAIQTPTLALDKTADKQNYSAVGDVITYNYNVTNTGNVGISGNITVTDDKLGNFTIANSVLAPDS